MVWVFFVHFSRKNWTIHLYSVQMAIADLVISTSMIEVDFFFSTEAGEKLLKHSLTVLYSINVSLQKFVLLQLGCNCLNHQKQRGEWK